MTAAKNKPAVKKPPVKKTTVKAPAKKPAPKKAAPKGYKKNPVTPGNERKMLAGVDLFEKFTGHEATHYDRVTLPDMSVCVQIGELDGIAYETVRDGKRHRYFHKFKKAARPIFAVTHDGEAVVIVGGRFKFTERGIVDHGSNE